LTTTSSDYSTAITVLRSLNLKGNQIPVFVESNTTHIRIFYNDGKSTYEINHKKGSNNEIKNNVVANRD